MSAGFFNRHVTATGEPFKVGPDGGRLLLSPPNQMPGQMTRTDLENRTWHLLREPGPDTGQPAPQVGDFAQRIVDRDLNIALAQFLSQCGWAPKLSEVMRDYPVYPGLDYPLPPDCQALNRIDYTIAGQTPYKLIPLNWEDFDRKLGNQIPAATGNPYYYRVSFAGKIRLQPQPTVANFVGPGLGTISFTGVPTAGDQVWAILQNPPTPPVTTLRYTVIPTDSLANVAFALAQLINNSAAVQGIFAFLQAAQVYGNSTTFNALFPQQGSQFIPPSGTRILYQGASTSTTMFINPTEPTNLSPQGDRMTFYYTSSGNMMLGPDDTPGIPPQFHMALCYRLLMDYWRRKTDVAQAREYERMYKDAVLEGKKLELDTERETQFTIAGVDDSELFGTPGIPY